MSTNENSNKDVSFTDSQTKSQINIELSETESKIMENVEHQSTPVQSKKSDDSYEMFRMIQVMLEKQTINMNSRFYVNDRKFDEQNSNFNEIKNEINGKFEKIDEKFETMTDKILEAVSTQIDSLESRMIKVDEVFKSCLLYTSRCV